MVIAQDPDQATKTVRDCVCADCWGELIARYDPQTRTSTVTCSTPGCPCNGYRSRKGVERAESQAQGDAAEARIVLKAAMPWLPKKSEKQLLSELGF